jgi:hypothetical protein
MGRILWLGRETGVCESSANWTSTPLQASTYAGALILVQLHQCVLHVLHGVGFRNGACFGIMQVPAAVLQIAENARHAAALPYRTDAMSIL